MQESYESQKLNQVSSEIENFLSNNQVNANPTKDDLAALLASVDEAISALENLDELEKLLA